MTADNRAPDAVTDPPAEVEMTPADDIKGFDPRTDSATTVNGGKVKQMFQNLCRRGNYESADELRQKPTVRKQLAFARTFPKFDPAHDPRNTVSKIRVAKTHDWLLEHGYENEAATLCGLGTVREQISQAREFQSQYGVALSEL